MTDRHFDVVFSGEFGTGLTFVEVENELGSSVRFGEWVKRDDGYWALRFESLAPSGPLSDLKDVSTNQQGENNESKATDSNEIRDGLSRIGDGAGTEERGGVHPVVDVARQVVQGQEDNPLTTLRGWRDDLRREAKKHDSSALHSKANVVDEVLAVLESEFPWLQRGPLSDEPRESENQDGAAPVLGGETK